MAEVSLEAVKVPVSGSIVDAVPAEAVVHDVDPGAAVGGTSPKIWTKQLKKITCPKFGTKTEFRRRLKTTRNSPPCRRPGAGATATASISGPKSGQGGHFTPGG
eukprot:COSAG01_NODE_5380_length_4295_cov_312.910867_1_plen_104_part_00